MSFLTAHSQPATGHSRPQRCSSTSRSKKRNLVQIGDRRRAVRERVIESDSSHDMCALE